ncbi:unnamed protein product [Kuraishia capsulata CBS 1993]|uniref:Uracil permease n=1 Tax=Kuraishia capsulata CBS 1993 TaxID=1382522 RepID=W6MLV8_9ASCO|nr:uncharacterized protein KUCA_T00001838001 [Kuraishia capsulata CBS 1993]CDK25867.1 unnamed protein product [Kuraishia capsulata CBS 1993]
MKVWLVDIIRNPENLSWAERLEVPSDEGRNYKVDQWCNRDLIPIPKERRTYTTMSYFGYWTVSGACVSAWTIGSTMLSYGLNAKQAIACVVVGSLLTGLLAISCGWMGEMYQIGFTVSSRYSYGFYGSYIPVVIRSFIACMWFGMQAYWGGQATRNLIGAIIPGFIDGSLANEFSGSSHLAKNDFIGLCIWGIFFCYFLTIPPERMQIPFYVSFVFFVGTCFGLLGWAVSVAGGAGPLFHSKATTTGSVGWGVMFGITALIGSWGAGCLGQSDWTRYAKTRYAPTLSQMIAAPMTIIVTAIIGVIVTSASYTVFDELVWNPIQLIPRIQQHYHSSPGARAGCFFASIGLVTAQMTISVVLNSVSTGMDLSGLCPKYINIRRGGYLMAAIGILCQPWQLLATAAKFLTVLSGFGIFVAPMTGVMLADFFVARKMKLRVCDLYRTHDSIYWLGEEGNWRGGFNWRGFVSAALGTAFLMPGLIAAAGPYSIASGWSRLYNLTFIVGTAISFAVSCTLNYFFPTPGNGLVAPFIEEDIISARFSSAGEGSNDEGKEPYSVQVDSV